MNIRALGEHRFGLGRCVENMLFVNIGTEIGCGIVVGGRLYRGSQGCAEDVAGVVGASVLAAEGVLEVAS